MRIGFLSFHNPLNRYSFSGTTYHAYKALKQLPDIHTSLLARHYFSQENIRQLARKFSHKISTGKLNFAKWVDEKNHQDFLYHVEQDLRENSFDAVVALVCSGVLNELRLKEYPPFVLVTDATVSYLKENYDHDYQVSPEDHLSEYQAIQKSSKLVYSSDFMANRAKVEYHDILSENPNKVHVIPFGTNIDSVPEQITVRSVDDRLNLLFVGRNWQRKGGDIVLETLQYLRKQNINAHLTIVGSNPEVAKGHPNVTVIPHLNKNKPEQQQQYFDILNQSHFLLLPTRADCTPMVIAEANAFGVPALVSDVGGIGTLVKSGLNGFLFPFTARGDQYGDIAAHLFTNPQTYHQLSVTSRREYDTRLNWNAWAKQIHQLVLGHKKPEKQPEKICAK